MVFQGVSRFAPYPALPASPLYIISNMGVAFDSNYHAAHGSMDIQNI